MVDHAVPGDDRPLAGIRVIDLSTMLMAPYATQILGDMGADVVKIEPPLGDPIRGIGPLRHPGMGAIFMNANRSKRSVALDLKRADGLAVLRRLLATADVLVYNLRPQAMARLGLGYEAIAAINPRIIVAGLFGFGQEGPYAGRPAFDDLIQGGVGVPWLSHLADGRDPAYAPTAIADRGVALWAVGQINAALVHQLRTGRGQRIDIPMFEVMASLVLADHLGGHAFEPPIGPLGYARMLNPDRRPCRTQDGYLCVMIYTDRHWQAWLSMTGRPDVFADDPRYRDMTSRTRHIAALYADVAEQLRTRTTAEWMAGFEQADIPAMPLHTLESLLVDPHLAAVGFFSTEDHPSEGPVRSMAYPGCWSATPPRSTRPVPRLGEQGDEVLGEAGYSPAEIAALRQAGVLVGP